MITVLDIAAAPEPILRIWYRTLPLRDEPGECVIERLCLRAEGLGMIDEQGRLKA